MMAFFAWIEQSALSLWIATAYFAFPAILTAHSIGMGFLVGVFLLIKLRVLGFPASLPPATLKALLPLAAWSLVLVFLSGFLLLLAYPAKSLTNPLFYAKMLMLVLAYWLGRKLCLQVQVAAPVSSQQKLQALAGLLLWAAVIAAGRFLAYTYSILLASDIY